jgi:NADPH2:quinone reductase
VRRIPIDDGLWDILNRQEAARLERKPSERVRFGVALRDRFSDRHVFIGRESTPLTAPYTYHMLMQYCRKAGIPTQTFDGEGLPLKPVDVHSLRRIFATEFLGSNPLGTIAMKAAFIEGTGAPDVIRYGDLPNPTPREGEVLVRVVAVAVNPIDTYIRSGAVAVPLPKPFIIGCDLAGTVEALGPGAKRFRVGDHVWGSNQGRLGRQGTFAEYAAVHEDWLYPTPAGVSDEEAAAVALTGITAHIGLFRCAGTQPGDVVFVNGGTGGVGSMVVQMARAVGAQVVTTVGSAEKAAQCQKWGADRVINYKTADVAAAVRDFTKGHGVTVWYETLREPDFLKTVPLLARRGRMIVMAGRQAQPIFPVGTFYGNDLSVLGFTIFNATPAEQRRAADDINRWLGEKKLSPLIGRRLPLSEAAAAHRLQEENTVQKAGTLEGKIVLTP